MKEVSDSWVSVSATTRLPRKREVEGKDYFFVSDEEFDKLIEEDAFLEWANVHGKRYGTLMSTVNEAIKKGQQVILEIDVQGAFQVKNKMPDAHLVFIEPPSLRVLKKRLCRRGSETPNMIEQRMNTAKLELSEKMKYDRRLINDKLHIAVDELVSYVNQQANHE